MSEGIFPLMAVIDAYQASTGLSDSTISSRVFGDGRKVGHLRDGRTITMSRFDQAMRWFSVNWPADAVWPSAVKRVDGSSMGEVAA